MRKTLYSLWFVPRKIIARAITVYERTLSPDHGLLKHFYPYGFCRHTPTCSEFSKQVFLKKGVIKGTFLTLRRLLTCHPWAKPGDERLKEAIKRSQEYTDTQ